MSESNKRHQQVARLLPDHWNRKPFALATELREFLSTIKDENTAIDSGGGDGIGDLWVTVGGVEYYISIQPSQKFLAASDQRKA